MKKKQHSIKLGKFTRSKDYIVDVTADEKTFNLFAKYGKEVATREDYIQIGFLQALRNAAGKTISEKSKAKK